MEWRPGSGKKQDLPEVDRAGFSSTDEAKQKVNPAQSAFFERLDQLQEQRK